MNWRVCYLPCAWIVWAKLPWGMMVPVRCSCCRDVALVAVSDTPVWSCCAQSRNCSVSVPFPMPAWPLCTEQHRPGAPWGHGVRPVSAVPGERAGHQLQVPRLQVFEGCTEVRQGHWAGSGCWAGSLLGWVPAVRASTVTDCSHGRVWFQKWILSLVPEPRSWCSIQVCYFKRWRSIVLKVNCGICCDAACSKKNLSRGS